MCRLLPAAAGIYHSRDQDISIAGIAVGQGDRAAEVVAAQSPRAFPRVWVVPAAQHGQPLLFPGGSRLGIRCFPIHSATWGIKFPPEAALAACIGEAFFLLGSI